MGSERRLGTCNQGIAYEIKICALLGLRFLNSKFKIKNFQISQNIKHFGNFDDAILNLEKENGDLVTYCIQLKHFQLDGVERRKHLTYKNFCYKSPSKTKHKSPFGLDGYWKSVKHLRDFEKENVKYIIFTNKRKDEREKRFTSCTDCEAIDLINFSGDAFQFESSLADDLFETECLENEKEYALDFLKKMRVLCKQPHEEDLKNLIKNDLVDMFQLDALRGEEVVSKYLNHVSNLINGHCGGARHLSKVEVIFKLTEFSLQPLVSQFRFDEEAFPRAAVQDWLKIIKDFDVILIQDSKPDERCISFACSHVIEVLKIYTSITTWNIVFTSDDLDCLYARGGDVLEQELEEYWGNEKVTQVTLQIVYFYLWMKNLLPLILIVQNEEQLRTIACFVRIAPGKLIIFYANSLSSDHWFFQLKFRDQTSDSELRLMNQSEMRSGEANMLCSFLDLAKPDQLFIQEQLISFQGRHVKTGCVLFDDWTKKHLLVKDMLKILMRKFHLGTNNLKLPYIFIPRVLNRVYVEPNIFDERIIYILLCKGKNMLHKYFFEHGREVSDCEIFVFSKHRSYLGCEVCSSLSNLCNLPKGCKLLVNVDYSIDEISKMIQEHVVNKVEFFIFALEESKNCLNISSVNSSYIQIVNVIITSKCCFKSFLLTKSIVASEYEIYDYSEIDFNNLSVTCRFIITTNENDAMKIKNTLLGNVSYCFYRLTRTNETFLLEYLGSFGQSNRVCEFREQNFIDYEEANSNYDFSYCYWLNNLNVITGSPGMGKSVLITYLMQICPSKFWAILLELNLETNYFEESSFNDEARLVDHLRYFLRYNFSNVIEQICIDSYLSRKKICLFFDAFDEIPSHLEDKVCDFMRLILRSGYTIFVTTRNVKANDLEGKLKCISRTIVPFREQDQFEYLTRYYKSHIENSQKHSNQIDRFVKDLLRKTRSEKAVWDLEFAGIPLQTVMISEIYLEMCERICVTLESHSSESLIIDVLSLYKQFVELKVRTLKHKEHFDGPNMEKYFNLAIRQSLENHKLVALKSIFGVTDPEADISQVINDVKSCKIGLVDKFFGDDIPIFVHRTFAEYLSALYISENFRKTFVRDLVRRIALCSPTYDIVRQILDRLLSLDCPLHRSLLNEDAASFEQLSRDDAELRRVDGAGRNIMHLCLAWGRRTQLPNVEELDDLGNGIWYDFDNKMKSLHKNCQKGKSYRRFLELILPRFPEELLFDVDDLLKATPFEYGVGVLCLENVDALLNRVFRLTTYLQGTGHIESHLQTLLKSEMGFKYRQFLLACCLYDWGNVASLVFGVQLKECLVHELTFGEKEVSLIHVAAYCGSDKIIPLLIKEGINVDVVDKTDSFSPLHWASYKGNLSTVKVLLDYKADVQILDVKGCSALYFAALEGHADIRRILSEREAQLGGRRTVITELYLTSAKGDEKRVKLLLVAGEDPNEQSDGGQTPLMVACAQGHLDTVRVLLSFGADVDRTNDHNMTALMEATWFGRTEIVEMLLDSNADVSLRSKHGWTALAYAKYLNHNRVVDLLMEAGALE